MKLLLIYGPPAVGKLTVAKHIVAQTDFKLFDNHISIDFVENVFKRGHPSFSKTVDAVRMLMFEEAAKADVDLLFTLVYAHPIDTPYIAAIIETIEKHGGDVLLVHLTCTEEHLLQRVTNPSRASKNAITDTKTLTKLLRDYDLYSPFPESESFSIITDDKNPEETAKEIIEYVSKSPKE